MTHVLTGILGLCINHNLDSRIGRMHSLNFATQMQIEEDIYTCAKQKEVVS